MKSSPSTKRQKIGFAALLSIAGLFLMFFLGEGASGRGPISGLAGWALWLGGTGVYFLAVQYLLSRGNPQAVRMDWPIILALNWTLLFVTVLALLFESHKRAALAALCVALCAVACSYAGAALAARTARR